LSESGLCIIDEDLLVGQVSRGYGEGRRNEARDDDLLPLETRGFRLLRGEVGKVFFEVAQIGDAARTWS